VSQGEIIIYKPDNTSTQLEVLIEDETVWLSQAQLVLLFDSTKQNISLHINNIFKEGELSQSATVKDYLTVQLEGIRKVKRNVTFYNLDVIISVGYRVKSQRGTQFRIWANHVLKNYLMKGYAIHHRVERIEKKLIEHDQTFDLLINTKLPPQEGIFYDGQIFDAYAFVSNIVKNSTSSIILIDNYIDEAVLTLLSKRNRGVKAIIYTQKITNQLKLDIEKHNKQYAPIVIMEFTKSHDRFLIIDKKTIYHIGASLKDLGKKWFAFSKINLDLEELLGKLGKQKEME